MPDTNTDKLGFVKPEVGGSDNSWGTKTNNNWDMADTEIDKRVKQSGDTMTGALVLESANPRINFSDTDIGAANRTVSIDGYDGMFFFRSRDAAGAVVNTLAKLERDGKFTLYGKMVLTDILTVEVGGSIFKGTPIIESGSPQLRFVDTDAASNSKVMSIDGYDGSFIVRSRDDNNAVISTPLVVDRNGVLTSIGDHYISNAAPRLFLNDTDTAANARKISLDGSNGVFTVRARADDDAVQNSMFSVDRSGNATFYGLITGNARASFSAPTNVLLELTKTDADRGGYIAYYDKNAVRSAFVGFGSASATIFQINAERATEILLNAGGGAAVSVSTAGDIAVPGNITVTGTVDNKMPAATVGNYRFINNSGTLRAAVQADVDATYVRLRKYTSTGASAAYVHVSDDDVQALAVGTTLVGGSVITRTRGDARYQAISSQRFKEEIKDATVNALNIIKKLKPKQWKWGGDVPDGDERRGRIGYGLIAEEVVADMPPAGTYVWEMDEEGNDTQTLKLQGLDTMALLTLLIDSMQQVDNRLVQLNQRVTQLEQTP